LIVKGSKVKKFVGGLALLTLVLGLGGGPAAWAESNTVVGGSVNARLDFQITIPTILLLQVGTPGATIDRVSCTLADVPGSGAVAMTSSGANPVPVRVSALVATGATVRLLANSSTPLSNGAGGTIPFDQISWTSGGAPFSSGTFSNGAAQVLDTFTGSGNRTGTYAFTYANANYYATGTYNGQVTYTAATP
jgi:hypothetical protein